MTSAWANYKLGFKLLQVEETWDVDNHLQPGTVGTTEGPRT